MARPEWERYSVGEASSREGRTNADCYPLDTIYHVSHVSDAYRIFEDERIRATLVADESKLRKTRSSVTWLSPNTWANGSFYGNIRFEFDWRELIEDKKFYWVEAMPYSPAAYRILVTEDKPKLELERYRPESDNGPLYHDSTKDAWYCNMKLTGEFMLDGDLPLRKCKTVSFENHHDAICKRDGTACSQRGLARYQAGAALLSRLIGQNVLNQKESLRRLFLDKGSLHSEAENAWGNIVRSFSRIETNGRLSHNDEAASPLVTAMLDRYATKRRIKELGYLFRTREELESALRHRVGRAFGISVERVTGSED